VPAAADVQYTIDIPETIKFPGRFNPWVNGAIMWLKLGGIVGPAPATAAAAGASADAAGTAAAAAAAAAAAGGGAVVAWQLHSMHMAAAPTHELCIRVSIDAPIDSADGRRVMDLEPFVKAYPWARITYVDILRKHIPCVGKQPLLLSTIFPTKVRRGKALPLLFLALIGLPLFNTAEANALVVHTFVKGSLDVDFWQAQCPDWGMAHLVTRGAKRKAPLAPPRPRAKLAAAVAAPSAGSNGYSFMNSQRAMLIARAQQKRRRRRHRR
jgi:hypothetical protein